MGNDSKSLTPKGQGLFQPTARDVLDSAFTDLDESEAREVKKLAREEVLKLQVEKERSEIRNDNASRQVGMLIDTSRTLDRNVDKYDINSNIETASGNTQIRISRNKTGTQVTWAIIILALVAIVVYLATH